MPNTRMIKSVLSEYGVGWTINRTLYSVKLKTMRMVSYTEKYYEKRTDYPKRLDLFQIDVNALQIFLHERLSEKDKTWLINVADKACEGIIIGFSSIELNYGNPIDWQLSPLTGKRCDEKKKWYKISDFDKERGDIKVIWEASRLSHFLTLARAYILSENEKYYKAFSSQLKDWLVKNPYSYGANFKCSQECSLRMVNVLLAFTVFKECGVTSDADVSCVKDLVDRCYRKVLSNFFYAYKCIKNNHTISELMGMIVGAWCCGDVKQLDKAYSLLDEIIDEQFTDDGGYRQFSFNYQRFALQDLECVMSISQKTGKELSYRSKDKIRNSAMLLFQCQDENGDVPNYGSNDGALVFPVVSCDYRDFRSVINTTYALITGNQLFDEDKHQEELIWFSDGRSLQEFTIKKKKRMFSQFINAGLFTIRTPHSWAMIISNEYHSRPAHMDQLHLDLWINGVNVLCDSGTYSYASEEGRELVKNSSHNNVWIEGKPQMNTSGAFIIYDWTKRELGKCDDNNFSGKIISRNGYEHVREVKRIGVSYEITDKVNKDYKVLFHTPCNVILSDGKAVLSKDDKVLCEIKSSGEMKLLKSQRSLYYLKKEEIYLLSIIGQAGKQIKTIIEIIEGENYR